MWHSMCQPPGNTFLNAMILTENVQKMCIDSSHSTANLILHFSWMSHRLLRLAWSQVLPLSCQLSLSLLTPRVGSIGLVCIVWKSGWRPPRAWQACQWVASSFCPAQARPPGLVPKLAAHQAAAALSLNRTSPRRPSPSQTRRCRPDWAPRPQTISRSNTRAGTTNRTVGDHARFHGHDRGASTSHPDQSPQTQWYN